MYRISANSFRGNYSLLDLTLCTVTFDHSNHRCGNYSRAETIKYLEVITAETIQGRKLFKGGNYSRKYGNQFNDFSNQPLKLISSNFGGKFSIIKISTIKFPFKIFFTQFQKPNSFKTTSASSLIEIFLLVSNTFPSLEEQNCLL